MKTMKRKDYQNPTTKVVKLQHRTTLLAGSDTRATEQLQNYAIEIDAEE